MSIMKKMLEDLAAQHSDGVHSGERLKNSSGKLTAHPTVDMIDPVELSDKETRKDFEKEVDKAVRGEAQELETPEGGDIPHTHKYTPGKNRTETELGHDHPIIYKNNKVVGIGKGPHEGHTHEL